MMQVGLEFGPLLGRFLVDFEPKLGAKLGPSWHQNLKNRTPENHQKNDQKKVTRGSRGESVSWPLRILQTQVPQGPRDPGVGGFLGASRSPS